MSENVTSRGLTRRELLKKGAILGGALAWAAPTVQIIGMQPAMASHVSDLCICVKFDGSDDNSNYWTSIGQFGTQGTCLPAFPSGCENFDPDSTFEAGNCGGDADTFCIEQDGDTWFLYFPKYCELIEVHTKCGSACETPGFDVTELENSNVAEITPCSSLSHFEFCFRC